MSRRPHGPRPKFPLARVQALIAWGCYRITESALAGAAALHLGEEDVAECVCDLTERDFDRTLDSHTIPGTFQDVYRPRFHGIEIYLKVRMVGDTEAVVISFKQDTS